MLYELVKVITGQREQPQDCLDLHQNAMYGIPLVFDRGCLKGSNRRVGNVSASDATMVRVVVASATRIQELVCLQHITRMANHSLAPQDGHVGVWQPDH